MRKIRLSGWGLALVALVSLTSLLTSAARLNTSWLVPTGNIKVDYNVLGKPEMKVCALTFDDGPDTKFTPAVAAILEKYSIKATFFVVGHRVDANPAGIEKLVQAGHEIGNHTQSHPDMSSLGANQQATQIGQLQKSLDKLGVKPGWFRPPYGKFNSTTVKAASKAGMETVLWTVDPRDWQLPGSSKITQRVLGGTVPGAVILLHSTNAQTVEALPAIIEGLQKKGYHFLTMTQWHAAVTGGAMPLAGDLAAQPRPSAAQSPVVEEPTALPAAPELLEERAAPAPLSTQGAPRLLPPFERKAGDAGPEAASEEPSPAAAARQPEAAIIESMPVQPDQGISEAAASSSVLNTTANFDGPESAWSVWQSGRAGELRSWASSVQAAGGPLAYALSLAEPVASARIEPNGKPESAPAAATRPAMETETIALVGAGAWGGASWQPASPLELATVLNHEQAQRNYRHRPGPAFYLYCAADHGDSALWDKLADYQRLGRLEGLLLGSQVPQSSVPSGPLPRTTADSASLYEAAMLDPGLQGAARALDVLMAGSNNIYITVRPGNLGGFEPASLGRGQRELLLLSRLVQGMSFDAAPEADFAPAWPVPPGARMARFYSDTAEVLAFYCPESDCDPLPLPAAARHYRVATLDRDNNLMLSPLGLESVDLGSNALLLYREL